MKNEKNILRNNLSVLIFAFFIINFLIFNLVFKGQQSLIEATQQYMSSAIIVLPFIFIVKLYKAKADNSALIFILIVIGILLRFERGIVLRWDIYQHDVGETCGHWDYIMYIVHNGKLPDSNTYQYYHPPLYHLISALWIKINIILGIRDEEILAESLQYLTGFYSSIIMLIAYEIFKELKFEGNVLLEVMALIVFSPALIYLSASINNDELMLVFVFLAILYTLRWYQQPNGKDLLILGGIIGLGMMAKLNMVFLTPCIALIFLKAVFIDRKVLLKKIWYQFIVFGVVAAGLGLWYPIRNYLRFNQPLNYIYEFSHKHQPYVGDYSIYERLFKFPFISRIINEPYCVNGADYNLPTYLIKSSVIGEYWHVGNEKVLIFFEIINMLLILSCILAGIYVTLFVKKRWAEKIIFGMYWLILIIAFIVFCLRYPFTFTMHFRYIMPTILIGAVFLGMADENLVESNKVVRYIKKSIRLLIVLFCSLSIITSFCIF